MNINIYIKWRQLKVNVNIYMRVESIICGSVANLSALCNFCCEEVKLYKKFNIPNVFIFLEKVENCLYYLANILSTIR